MSEKDSSRCFTLIELLMILLVFSMIDFFIWIAILIQH